MSPLTSCIVDSAATYIMVVKFRNTSWPPPPQLSLHRRAALSSNSNGTRSVYNRENPKSSLWDVYDLDCPPPLPLMCRLSHIWIGCQRYPPRKEELRGRGSNSISNFHHHNTNGGDVDSTWRHRWKLCRGNLPIRYLCTPHTLHEGKK
jgi:hypothetical protein